MRYLLLLLIPVTVLAHDVILRVDGDVVHTVGAERVDVTIADDQVRVDVQSGAEPPPDPPPAEPPPPSACGQRPPGVSIVSTGSMTKRFGKATYEPDPRTIIAFAFTTPGTGNHKGRATATRTSSSEQTKLLSLSACPGEYRQPVVLSNACLQIGWEAVQITFTTDPQANPQTDCILERGRTYYLNATSHRHFNNADLSCTTRQNCGFTFAREP